MKSYFGVSGPITFNPIYICKLHETINEPILNVITFSISCNLNIIIVLILFVCGHRPETEELLEFSMLMLTHLPEKTSKYWRCFITQATFIVFLKRQIFSLQKGDRAIKLYCFFEVGDKTVTNGYDVIAETIKPGNP